jgi:hypothetical protein
MNMQKKNNSTTQRINMLYRSKGVLCSKSRKVREPATTAFYNKFVNF